MKSIKAAIVAGIIGAAAGHYAALHVLASLDSAKPACAPQTVLLQA